MIEAGIEAGLVLAEVRRKGPLVHNITNYVSMNIMANVLLAAGASPAMVHAEEEAAEFAGIASALCINIGTLSRSWVSAMLAASEVAHQNSTPWVLDPVAVGATTYRQQATASLLEKQPTVIKGNASEIMALCGMQGGGKGVDATAGVDEAQAGAMTLARARHCIVAVTGPVDFITDGEQSYLVRNGHGSMPLVTALGCSLGGVIAAFCAVEKPLEATVAAMAFYGLAGEMAGRQSAHPGTFAGAFLDALHSLEPEEVSSSALIEKA